MKGLVNRPTFSIPTRQKDDQLYRIAQTAVSAGATATLPVRRIEGYGAVRFLAFADGSFRLRVEQAPTQDGPWVETERLSSSASPSGSGQQFVCQAVTPCGAFMRAFVDNTSGSLSTLELIGLGHPIAGGAGGGGGASTGGCDPGTVITTEADTAVGVGATVALPVVPAGTRRMTVQVTGGDDTTRVRIREAGGTAGAGRLLNLLGSTMYGETCGAVADLEAENVAGPAAAVMISFERD